MSTLDPPFKVGDVVMHTSWDLCVWMVEEIYLSFFDPGDPGMPKWSIRLSFYGGYTIPTDWGRELKIGDRFIDGGPTLEKLTNPFEILAWAALNPFDD